MSAPIAPPLAPAERPARIDSLTGVRGVAACVIVLFHFFVRDGHVAAVDPTAEVGPLSRAVQTGLPFVLRGYLMVDLFFLLSGFVLAYVYAGAIGSGRFSTRRYLWKRLARVYPLHAAVLAAYAAVVGGAAAVGVGFSDPTRYTARGMIEQLTLTNAWGVAERLTWNTPAWSISAEWGAYLFFPVLFRAVTRLRSATAAFAATAAAFGGVFAVDAVIDPESSLTIRTHDFGLLRILVEFPLGIAAWRVYRESAWRRPGRIAAGCVVAAAALMAFAPAYSDAVVVWLFAGFLISSAMHERAGGRSPLDRPWMVCLGEVSYAIYMTHALIQTVATGLFRKIPGAGEGTFDLLLAAAIPVTVVVSAGAYHLIEVPARAWLTGSEPAGGWGGLFGFGGRGGKASGGAGVSGAEPVAEPVDAG